MITKPIILTVATSLLLCSGCAAKNRWFSRKDYSEMQDPFMQSDAIASKDLETDSGSDTAGRARFDSLTADSGTTSNQPTVGRLDGPKPIERRVTAERDSATTGRLGRMGNASYPEDGGPATEGRASSQTGARSYKGPALSDFLRRKQTEAAGAADSKLGEAEQALNDPINAPTTRPSGGNLSPAARAAAIPTMNPEAQSFNSFLHEKAATVSRATERTTQTVSESNAAAADFASWAEQQKQEWTREGSDAISAAPVAAKRQVNDATSEVQGATDDFVENMNDEAAGSDDVAEPLMPQFSNRQPPQTSGRNAAPVFDEPAKPATASEENPFENPFDVADEAVPAVQSKSPAVNRPATAAKKPGTAVDDSFQMDSGWKPAQMVRP